MSSVCSTYPTTNFQLNRIDMPTAKDVATTLPPARKAATVDSPEQPKTHEKPAAKPDAPFTKVGRLITATIHFSVLIALIAFVAHQLLRTATADRRQAVVTLVAPSLQQVSSPTDGVFTAGRHFPKGTQVEQGELLGQIVSPAHQADLERMEARLANLERRKSEVLNGGRGPSFDHAIREVMDSIDSALVELSILNELTAQLTVRAPVSGYIEHGLSGSFPVTRDAAIAQLWQQGDPLLVEIEAPLKVIHSLIRQGEINTEFATSEGNIQATVTPIASSLKPIHKESNGRRDELWGLIQCQPVELPSAAAYPGAMGRL